MTVAARSANIATVPAYDLRASDVRAGAHSFEGVDVDTGWHRHPLHQIEYALEGVAEVETADGRYLLPPQQAIWLPAGLAHRTTLRRVRSLSVFFEPDLVPEPGTEARVLGAAPVVREMLAYAGRWPIDRTASDPVADAYFTALGVLVGDWLGHAEPLFLPTSSDPLVGAVMAHTEANLATVTEASVCRAVGVSPRTLRRRFAEATGTSWRTYLGDSRMLRATADLAEGSQTVLDIATSVGFESVSAFARAFQRRTGETPTAYRRRVRR